MVRTSEGSGSMSEFKRDRKDYHMVGKCVPKKDSNQLLLGKPVFMDDIVPQDCLVVKLLRSPHAHALVEEVKTGAPPKFRVSKPSIPGKMCRKNASVLPDRLIRSHLRMTV